MSSKASTNRHDDALLAALRDPSLYPGRPSRVDVRQTHISWVFLTGDLVYKLKKPVCFGFVDYSTPGLRLEYCRAEVTLNRRLARSVYLGVAPIVRHGGTFEIGAVDALDAREAVDHLVVMRRLPEARMLDRMIAAGEAGAPELERLAAKLAAFHGACPDRGERYGSLAAIREAVCGNLAECGAAVGATFDESRRSAVTTFMDRFLAEHESLFAARAAGGRIRDGHGDLRAEHVCLTDDLDVFDCVEFSERLRSADVASEIAFLAMDLDFLGEPVLADGFVRSYARFGDDAGVVSLQPFYRCHRALVRGKVEHLRSCEPEVAEEDRASAREASRRYFRLAARYARGPSAPELVVVCGLSGTGKSTVARMIGDITGFAALRSDAVRKDLAGVPRFAHPQGKAAESIYDTKTTRATYEELRRRARSALRAGYGVVLDATFRDLDECRRVIDLARSENVPVSFFECRASTKEVLRRLGARRAASNEVSDADAGVYRRQRGEPTRFADLPSDLHHVVDTERPRERIEEDLDAFFAARAPRDRFAR
jgi:aminoglycoside phosphotransferase family enzyme/predicted kinase